MFERFTDRSRRAIVLAQEESRRFNHRFIGTEHLLLGLMAEGEGIAASAIGGTGVTLDQLRSTVAEMVPGSDERTVGHVPFTPRCRRVLEAALREALQLGHNYIGTEHLLLGLLRDEESTAVQLLGVLGVTAGQLRTELLGLLRGDDLGGPDASPAGSAQGSGRERARTRSRESALEQFGTNLTQAAADGELDVIVGRDREVERTMQILGRRTKNNPVLIGEPGVGKTAVVEGLAQRLASGDVPEILSGKQIYSLDLGSMLAGTRYRGDFEERLKKVLKEVEDRDDVIVFLDEIHTLVGAGSGDGAMDAASILKPALSRGRLTVIGATTTDEYRKHVEKDAALERRFQPVTVEAPSVADTVAILTGLRPAYEEHHKVTITDDALTAAAELADRYIADRQLPDKAIDLMDEAGSRLRILKVPGSDPAVAELEAAVDRARADKDAAIAVQMYEEAARWRDEESRLAGELHEARSAAAAVVVSRPTVDADVIADVLAVWSGVPVARLTEAESKRLIDMEGELHRRIVGQDEAVVALSKAVRRSRAGLKDPKRPMGSFIFLGPSGVGKTEMARALAEFLFDDERALIQLDMSEYMEKHTVARLIGSPPGYVGHDEGGQLTEAVRRRPYSVVLFDEVEKAHPDVFNVLLQLLEEGQLTDAQGRSVSFRNTLVVLTSNLGTANMTAPAVGFAPGVAEDARRTMVSRAQEALKAHFRPELLNRIDDTVVFAPLSLDEVEQIVELLLGRVRMQLAERGVSLSLSGPARTWLASQGFDPQLGARPLRRAIQRHLEDPLSELLLSGPLPSGTEVAVDVPADPDAVTLVFSVVDAPLVLDSAPLPEVGDGLQDCVSSDPLV
jgi:ATP-dependent Clp protease ATP-binding subunit ClpC